MRNSLSGWPQGVDKHQRREDQACSHLQRAANAGLIFSASKFSKMSQLQLSFLRSFTGLSGFCANLCGAGKREGPQVTAAEGSNQVLPPGHARLWHALLCSYMQQWIWRHKALFKLLPRGDTTHPGINCKSALEDLTADGCCSVTLQTSGIHGG